MSCILAALDFGPAHSSVIDAAGDLAQAFRLPVHLVHVRAASNQRTEFVVHTDDPGYSKRLRREQRDLDNDVLKLRTMGLTVKVHLPRGDRAGEIIALAGQIHARYMVLGAREPSALRHLAVGSVPAEVLRRSPVPVVFSGHWQRIKSVPDAKAN